MRIYTFNIKVREIDEMMLYKTIAKDSDEAVGNMKRFFMRELHSLYHVKPISVSEKTKCRLVSEETIRKARANSEKYVPPRVALAPYSGEPEHVKRKRRNKNGEAND